MQIFVKKNESFCTKIAIFCPKNKKNTTFAANFNQKMLSILDRYILKKYLGTFFFIILMFSMLAAVIDFAEKVEDFMGAKAPPFSMVITDYYLNFIPFINSLLFPLYTLITVLFFTSRLAGNSEILGMLGCGINFYRLLKPYLIGGLIIASLHYMGNHFIFPSSSKIRVKFENTYIWRNNYKSPTDNIHFMLDKQNEMYIRSFNRKDSMGQDVWIMRYDTSGVQRPNTIIAKSIKCLGGQRWQLNNCQIRQVNGMKEQVFVRKQIDTNLNFATSDLVYRDNEQQGMQSAELQQYIDEQNARGMKSPVMHEVELHRRTADPFSNLVLTVIGFAVASRKTRGGMGWHLVIGGGISGLFIFMSKFSTTFATNAGFSPFIAIWIPNILFSLVAIGMLVWAKK